MSFENLKHLLQQSTSEILRKVLARSDSMNLLRQIIDLKAKPAEFVEKYKRAGGTGSALVPLLEHGGQYVIEITVVARYIDRREGRAPPPV